MMKRLRQERGLFQDDVAASIGVDRATYAKYEIGKFIAPPDRVVDLADVFQLTGAERLHFLALAGIWEYTGLTEDQSYIIAELLGLDE